jgi:hypothetical protein
MAIYLMFGTYSPEALRAVSGQRTDEAVAVTLETFDKLAA